MKKIYLKPEIMFESFTLSENIAGNCELKTNLPSSDAGCGYPTRGGVVFVEQIISACDTPPNNGGDVHDGFCYHNPSDGSNLFNS